MRRARSTARAVHGVCFSKLPRTYATLMGFSSAQWRAKMANTFSVLETLGISELFWRQVFANHHQLSDARSVEKACHRV